MFKQYQEAIENSNIVSKTDINGIITFVNDEFCKISGYSREELIGQNHNIVRHPDVPKENFKRLWDTILAKKTFKSTVKNLAKDGRTFYVNTTIVPILDEKGEIEEFIAIRYDVTKEVELKMALERKERELELLNRTLEERVRQQTRELYELNRHLEERVREEVAKNEEKQKMLMLQSRMAGLGQMMANIAHQWRQPLTELSLALYSIKKVAKEGDETLLEQLYDDAKNTIQSMSRTIDDFINFFKPDRKKALFDASASIKEALRIVHHSLEKSEVALSIRLDETAKIYGVKNELVQVIVNLLQNAKDAFEQQNLVNRHIFIGVCRRGRGVVLWIHDNAGGIKDEVLPRIFEPYFTTKHASKGTGLGLFMSKMIIEKGFNGDIEVTNRHNGARFVISLPLDGRKEM